MVIEAYQAYELGRKSAEELARRLSEILCCPGRDRECRDMLAMLAPYLSGADDCTLLEEDIDVYFAWLGLRWAYEPCGPPPHVKKRLVLRTLCSTRQPVPEELFKEVLGEKIGEAEETL